MDDKIKIPARNLLQYYKIYGGFLIFSVMILGFNYHTFNQKRTSFNEKKKYDLKLALDVIMSSYNKMSQVVYSEVVQQPDVLKILAQANSSSAIRRENAREALFKRLEPTYQRLKTLDIRQFHFHLPDNTSFLRFHKPEKFGDDLTDIRLSVSQVNSKLLPVSGFEEGRVKSGFRHVFPILDGDCHLGSVEISLSFAALQKTLESLFDKEFCFMIRCETVANKVFDEEKVNHAPSQLSPRFMVEKSFTPKPALKAINDRLKPLIASQIIKFKPFVSTLDLNEESYVITFHPLKNTAGKDVAYVMAYEEDPTFNQLRFELFARQGVATIILSIILILITKLIYAHEVIRIQAVEDALTRLPNRRSFADRIAIEVSRSYREEETLSVVMCDIDNFKHFNDTYGHQQGDRCLRQVARTIEQSLHRSTDFCARYGGEEFVILLSNTPLESAYAVAERVREAIEKLQITHDKNLPSRVVTLSLGVYSLSGGKSLTAEGLVKEADKLLYDAKAHGRNNVQCPIMASKVESAKSRLK